MINILLTMPVFHKENVKTFSLNVKIDGIQSQANTVDPRSTCSEKSS